MVIDGLGHGQKAKEATDTLRDLVDTAPVMQLSQLLLWCHERMRRTRGAAVAALVLDSIRKTVTYSGVGNISLYHAPMDGGQVSAKRMVSGILGYRSVQPQERVILYGEGDRFLFHTDGLNGGVSAISRLWHELPIRMARKAVEQFANRVDDALVLVVQTGNGVPDISEELWKAPLEE